MGFLDTITPAETEAGRALGLVTMAVLIGVGFIPPLRSYAQRIRVAMAAFYVLCVLGFVVYCALFR